MICLLKAGEAVSKALKRALDLPMIPFTGDYTGNGPAVFNYTSVKQVWQGKYGQLKVDFRGQTIHSVIYSVLHLYSFEI